MMESRQTYPTIKEMCKAYNVEYHPGHKRMFPLKDALTVPVKANKTMPCKDHKGVTYSSKKEMCKKYNISLDVFYHRIKNNWTLEKALTTPTKCIRKEYEDHKGNKYNSIKEMCEHYGINPATFGSRIESGKSIEEALTSELNLSPGCIEVIDHLGNHYNSVVEMCKHYGISTKLYYERIKTQKLSKKEALTRPINKTPSRKQSIDHLGVVFESQDAMCKYYNIPVATFIGRLKKGWSLEKALTTSSRKTHIQKNKNGMYEDYLGNEFKTISDMADYHNVDLKLMSHRLCEGATLKEALANKKTGIIDPWGKKYNSQKEMAEDHGLSYGMVSHRLKSGMTLKQALSAPRQQMVKIQDHLGNFFKTQKEMAKKYEIPYAIYKSRKRKGWDLEKNLTTPIKHIEKRRETGTPCTDHKGNPFPSIKAKCDFYGINTQLYLDRLAKGKDEEHALCDPIERKINPIDYKGKHYEKLTDLLDEKGVTMAQYYGRKKLGWSIEKIIETKGNANIHKCKDHLGKTYNSLKEMLMTYGVTTSMYHTRKKLGWTLEKILTTPVILHECKDHLGKIYKSKTDMCKAYGITIGVFERRLKKGWSLEKTLTTPAKEGSPKRRILQNDIFYLSCGINIMVISINCNNKKKVLVKAEDGLEYEVLKNSLMHGDAGHPLLKRNRKCEFCGFFIERCIGDAVDGTVLYRCKCKTCGIDTIMTPQQMIAHKKECHKELQA